MVLVFNSRPRASILFFIFLGESSVGTCLIHPIKVNIGIYRVTSQVLNMKRKMNILIILFFEVRIFVLLCFSYIKKDLPDQMIYDQLLIFNNQLISFFESINLFSFGPILSSILKLNYSKKEIEHFIQTHLKKLEEFETEKNILVRAYKLKRLQLLREYPTDLFKVEEFLDSTVATFNYA